MSSIPPQMTLVTSDATLVDVYESHHVDATYDLELTPPDEFGFLYDTFEVTSNSLRLEDEIQLFSGTVPVGNFGTAYLNVNVGDIRFTADDLALLLGLTILDSEMTEYHCISRSAVQFQCDLRVTAGAELEYEPPEKLICEQKKKIKQGFIKHCLTLRFYLGVIITAEAQASVTYDDLGAGMVARCGVEYGNQELTPVTEVELTIFPSEPHLSAGAKVVAIPYLKIKIEDKVYCKNYLKANLWTKPYIKGTATTDFETDWCLDVATGCDVGGGASLKLGSINILDWDFDLKSPTLDLYNECWPLPGLTPLPWSTGDLVPPAPLEPQSRQGM